MGLSRRAKSDKSCSRTKHLEANGRFFFGITGHVADKETAEIQNNVYKTLSPENYYPDRENTGTKKKKVTADGKIVSDFSKTTIDDFTLVVNRKRNKTRSDTVIKGSATNSILKGVEKQAHLHVYRLDKSTNVEDIVTHLKSNQFNKISCEKLQSKHPEEYTSFKISVPISDLDKIKNPDIWPTGTCINRYFLWKTSMKEKTQ